MEKNCSNSLLILASKSPRRRHLLKQAGLSFDVIPSSIDEKSVSISSSGASPGAYARLLAEAKVNDISMKYPESWVIGADTIVLIGETILGKPESKSEARAMLKQLNGKTHQVFTGYSICCRAKKRYFSETIKTDVLFKNLTDEEIEWYIHSKEPYDKAGAYAIQGLGTFLVKRINGSYTNVVGLPVCEVMEFLIKEGVLIFSKEVGN